MDSTNGSGAAAPPWTHTFGEPPPPARTPRGTMVTLADGHQWRLPPFSFYDLQVNQAVLDRALDNIAWTNPEAREAAVDLVHLALVRNYPGMPRDAVVALLDCDAAADAFSAIWIQNGMKVRDLLRRMGLDPPDSPTGTAPNQSPPAPTGDASTHG